ncbi:MAG: tRNA threonylcarbamoyladenosine dehydratase [Deltaproteobacteria bacterium]|nr:tRNA threonylcarbamoyladenosine dehydratase [Deltaproteobacteria bacterium]
MSTLVQLQTSPEPAALDLPPQVERDPRLPADYKLHRRFDRIGRLVGDVAMSRLERAHVIVFGVGGVGSFTAEALARSGVGTLTLVDFDLVCATNANRQLHALQGTTGEPKVVVMAERLRRINPKITVITRQEFYNATTSERLLSAPDAPPSPPASPGREPGDAPEARGAPIDFVVDAIDNMTAKCHLIQTCRDRGIPLVVVMGAAGRIDPTQVKVADLNRTEMDPFARMVRKVLRDKHGFPSRALTGIPAVFSDEPKIGPQDLLYDHGEGFRCVCPQGQNDFHSCEHRNQIEGSAGFVTGAFGLAAASVAVRALIGQKVL